MESIYPPIVESIYPPIHASPPGVIEVWGPTDWRQYRRTSDGELFFVNRKTKISTWEKPIELMDPVERVGALTVWTEYCCADYLTPQYGDSYYYNKMTKESVWTIPHELKVARECIVKASKFYEIYKDKDHLDICSKDPESGDQCNEFEETKILCDWLQHHLSDKVDKVQVSKLLMSPFALNSAKLGSTTTSSDSKYRLLGSTRNLRKGGLFFIINPDHPVIKELNAVLKIKHNSTLDKVVADFLYEVALISSGYAPTTPADLYSTVYLILEIGLAGRWGRSNCKARTGANTSDELAIETSVTMEELLGLVFEILNGSLAGNNLTLSSKGAK